MRAHQEICADVRGFFFSGIMVGLSLQHSVHYPYSHQAITYSHIPAIPWLPPSSVLLKKKKKNF